MKKILLILLSISSLLISEENKIQINNRVMTIIHGKPISVIDIAKKLDLQYLNEHKDQLDNIDARYQYYKKNWQAVFNELIDRELIIQSAQEKGMKVSDGDIKEELENIFGSNALEIIQNMGMTYKEAWEMIKNDIIVRRMTMHFVHNKSLKKITPQDIKLAYEDYCEQMKAKNTWEYTIITFDHQDINISSQLAAKAYDLLVNKEVSLKNLVEELEQNDTIVRISPIHTHDEESISEANKEILKALLPHTYSTPQLQQSRLNTNGVYRIIFLNDYQETSVPSLEEMEGAIKNYLLNAVSAKEYHKYLLKLREYYNVDMRNIAESLPTNFQPFLIK